MTRYGTAWLNAAAGLLEQRRWIGTGFYAHVGVTRVDDEPVRLRVGPHAQPGGFLTVWISWVLPAWWEPAAGNPAELAGRCRGTV